MVPNLQTSTKKVLLVANVAKEHVIKFHIPTIRMLADRGWIVDVACAGLDKIPYCNHQYTLSYERSGINWKLLKGIKELQKLIDEQNYDLIYCHTTIGGVAGRIASRHAHKQGTKVIYLSHGYFFYKGCPVSYWPTFFLTEKILARYTDAIITINEEDYEISKRHFQPCHVYRINGIGVDYDKLFITNPFEERKKCRLEMSIPLDATVLIYLAELHKNKNQELLLQVMQRLIEQGKDVFLVLAGFDHSNGRYQQLARSLGIADRTKFLGWRQDIGRLYAMADICTASSIREGFGLNLVEAMACGVPVVATRNRGHSSIIRDGENGFLVPIGAIDEFASRVSMLISDAELRRKFVSEGLQARDQYSSASVLRELSRIIDEVMAF